MTSVWSTLQTTFFTSVLMSHSDQTNRDLILSSFTRSLKYTVFLCMLGIPCYWKKKLYRNLFANKFGVRFHWLQSNVDISPSGSFLLLYLSLVFHIPPLLEKHCYVRSASFLSQKASSPDSLFIQCKQSSKIRQK